MKCCVFEHKMGNCASLTLENGIGSGDYDNPSWKGKYFRLKDQYYPCLYLRSSGYSRCFLNAQNEEIWRRMDQFSMASALVTMYTPGDAI